MNKCLPNMFNPEAMSIFFTQKHFYEKIDYTIFFIADRLHVCGF